MTTNQLISSTPYQPMVTVDGEKIPIYQVSVIDIEEDMYGYDLCTFVYDNNTYSSYITLI